MAESTAIQVATGSQLAKPDLLQRFSQRYEIDATKVLAIVGATVFRQGKDEPPLSPEETQAALIVINQYDLNPFTKEIYAFRSKGKLLIIVGVDGWSVIVNRQEQLNGIEFEEHFDDKGAIQSVTCKIHRKDRALPTVITEYTRECKRDTDPWRNMPVRMTRNRAFVQCARLAFSITGIIEEDEAQTIEGAPARAIIEGNAPAELQAPPEETIGAEGGSQFYKMYRSSGWTKEESAKFLADTFKIGQPHNDKDSRSIPKSKFEDAKKWAETKAPVRIECERVCHDLGFTADEFWAFVNDRKTDWKKCLEDANVELAKRNQNEQ